MHRQWGRRLLWCGAILVLLILLVLVSYFMAISWLTSKPGRAWVANQIEHYASTETYTVQVDEIATLNSRHIAIPSIIVQDASGKLVVVRSIAMDYRLWPLLVGHLTIDRLIIDAIHIDRLPESSVSDHRAPMDFSIPHFDLKQLNIHNLSLNPSVTGFSEHLALDGRVMVASSLIDSAIVLHVRDLKRDQSIVNIVFQPDKHGALALHAQIKDMGQGMLSRITDLPSLAVSLDGTGTLDDWQGELTFAIGDDFSAEQTLHLDLGASAPILKMAGVWRHDDLTAEGDTTFTLWPQHSRLQTRFAGNIATPTIQSTGASFDAVFKRQRTLPQRGSWRPLALKLAGNTGTVSLLDHADAKKMTPVDIISDVSVTAAATFHSTHVRLDSGHLQAASFAVDMAGEFLLDTSDPDTPDIVLDTRMTLPNLARFDPDIQGELVIQSTLTGHYQPLRLQADAEAKADQLVTVWPVVNQLIGTTPAIKTTLSYGDGQLILANGTLFAHELYDTTFSGVIDEQATHLQITTAYQDYTLNTDLKLADSTLAFDNLSMIGPAGTISGDGALTISPQNLQAHVNYQADDNMTLSMHLSGRLSALTAHGVWAGYGTIPYQFNYRAKLTPDTDPILTLTTFSGQWGAGDSVNLVRPVGVCLHEDTVQVDDLTLAINGGLLSSTATFSHDQFNATLNANDIPARFKTWPLFDGGWITGQGAIHGAYSQPEGQLELLLHDIQLSGLATTPEATINGQLHAHYSDTQLTVDATLEGAAYGLLEATGSLYATLSPAQLLINKPLKANIQSNVDLQALTHLLGLDEHQLQGWLVLELALSGSLNKPTIEGQGSWRDGVYENLLTGTYLSDMSATIAANKQTVSITHITGRDRAAGTFTADASLTWKEPLNPHYALSFNAHTLQFIDTDPMSLVASGHTELHGDKQAAQLSGNITINRADYYISDVVSTDALDDFEIIEISGDQQPSTNQFPNQGPTVGLNLQIEANNQVFIRGPDLESQWRGMLNITGFMQDPIITGTMTLLNGQFQLLDVPINFNKGNIRFINPNPANPALDIHGIMKGRDIDALLHIFGTAQAPQIGLTSDPVLPEDEILARALFGSTVSQLTPVQALRIAQLMARLSGQSAGFDPLARLRQMIGIDTLTISTDSEGGAALSAGKYINDRVYIGLDQGASAESSSVRTQVDLTKKLELEATTSSTDDNSIGINWRHDY